MADWREVMLDKLIEICKTDGIAEYDEAQVLAKLKQLADIERPKDTKERIGFAYAVDNYKDRGMTSFLGKVKNAWKREPSAAGATASAETPPAPPAPTRPTPPPPPAPPRPVVAGKPELFCVFTVTLRPGHFVSAVPHDLVAVMHSYLFGATGFDARVTDAAILQPNQWDLQVGYTCDLMKVHDALAIHPWVLSVQTRAFTEFGRV